MVADKIIDYQDLIDKSTRGFVGRQWVRDNVDAFLQATGPRYFLLLGEPGSGKTAFMADLVRQHGYPHHFIGAGSQLWVPQSVDWRNPVRFAESLGYQLLRDYGGWIMDWDSWGIDVTQTVRDLEGQQVGAHVEHFAASPRPRNRPTLSVTQETARLGAAAQVVGVYVERWEVDPIQVVRQLLLTPLGRIAERWPDQQIVIVLDGLDEAPNVSDPLHSIVALLPNGSLPANVRWLLSSRPGEHLTQALLNQAQSFWLGEDDQGRRDLRVEEDAAAYVRNLASEALVQRLLQEKGIDEEELAVRVARSSLGNFLYLYHYAQGLRAGDTHLLNLEELPEGLYGIYEDFLGKIRDQREHDVPWDTAYKPLLAALAVAREPVTSAQLAAFSGVPRQTVGTMLRHLRPFLDSTKGPAATRRYKIYHLSFGEYLLSEQNEDYIDGREGHSRIADWYLNDWGGLAQGLPALRDRDVAAIDGYGLRHVIQHLDRAGRSVELHVVLTLSWAVDARRSNAWFSVHQKIGDLVAYRRDLSTAWDAARQQDASSRFALQLRYALMTSSLNSQTVTTPPALWSILVTYGQLTAEEALTQAHRMPTADGRAEALTDLIKVVPDSMRDEVEHAALAAVQAVPDGYWRVAELWRLHRNISGNRRQELLAIVEAMADPYYQIMAYRLLGVEEQLPTLSLRLDAEHESLESPSGLAGSADFVEGYLHRWHFAASRLKQAGLGAVDELKRATGDPVERYWRAHLLALAAAESSGEDGRALAAAALAMGEGIGDWQEITAAWGMLGTRLTAATAVDVLGMMPNISDPVARMVFLLHAAARLGSMDQKIDQLMVETLTSLTREHGLQTVIVEAGTALAQRGLHELIELASHIDDATERAEALLAVAPLVATADAEQIAAHVLEIMQGNVGLTWSPSMLSRTVAFLPAASLASVPQMANTLPNPDVQSSIYAAVGVRYCELRYVQQAIEMLQSVHGFSREFLIRALAQAHARVGDPQQAVILATELPYASWQTEALALALHRLDPSAAAAALDVVGAVANRLDVSSKVAILAHAAALVPAAYQAGLSASALAAAEEIDDFSEKSLALLAVAEMLLAQHDLAKALSVSMQIPVERIHVEALVAVLAEADKEVAQQVAARARSVGEPEPRVQLRVAALRAALRLRSSDAGAASRTTLRQTFDETLGEFVVLPRSQLLNAFSVLVSAAELLDGPQIIPAIAADLANIVEWWP